MLQQNKEDNPGKQNGKNVIIITKEIHSHRPHTSKLTYKDGCYNIQCELKDKTNQVNKEIINKKVKQIQNTIEVSKPMENENNSIDVHRRITTDEKFYDNGETKDKGSHHSNIEEERLEDRKANGIANEKNKLKEDMAHNENENNENNGSEETQRKNLNQRIAQFIVINNPLVNIQMSPITKNNCILCSGEFLLPNLLQSNSCDHSFCKKCIKYYFEDQVEQGYKNLKCPIYSCQGQYEISKMKILISKHHFNSLLGTNKFYNPIQTKLMFSNEESSKRIQMYIQKHVIDINTNEDFYMFNKVKIEYCPKCLQAALFGKIGVHFIKCLNCYYSICKYCQKEFTKDHMDILSPNHCKVFYRKEDEDEEDSNAKKKYNCFTDFLIELLMVIASFILILCAGFGYIYDGVHWVFCKKRNYLVKIIVTFSSIIFYIIAFPIIFMCYAYYPIFISIFY